MTTNKEIELAAKLFHQSYYDGDLDEVRRIKAVRALHAAKVFYEEAAKRGQDKSALSKWLSKW